MKTVPPTEVTEALEDPMPDLYNEFRDAENIPVHKGLAIDNVNNIETGRWDRTGQEGAFINLYGMQGLDDIHVHNIRPGEEISRQKHFYEEIVYVSQGTGATVIGQDENERTFEWDEQACFLIPKNTPYKHINLSEDEPVRLICQTSLPQLLNLIQDIDFIFNCDYDFWSEIASTESNFYDAEGETGSMYEGKYGDAGSPMTWDSNFIPDITKFDKMKTWNKLGATKIVFIPFPRSSHFVHLSEWSTGMYKNAHRHGPGANVFIRSGEGYTLMWRPEWDYRVKVDWSMYSLVTPPAGWYHQHFNTSDESAGQFAIHGPRTGGLHKGGLFDAHDSNNIIDYIDEDPDVRELYKGELEQRGLEFRMPEDCYTDPNFNFEEENI